MAWRRSRRRSLRAPGAFHGILHSVGTATAATTEAPQWQGGRRRIGSVGHRITGRQTGVVNRHLGIGWEFVHVCIDDASRIAFIRVMKDERKATAIAFLEAAVAYYTSLGIKVERVAKPCLRCRLEPRLCRHSNLSLSATANSAGKCLARPETGVAFLGPLADSRRQGLPGRPQTVRTSAAPAAMNPEPSFRSLDPGGPIKRRHLQPFNLQQASASDALQIAVQSRCRLDDRPRRPIRSPRRRAAESIGASGNGTRCSPVRANRTHTASPPMTEPRRCTASEVAMPSRPHAAASPSMMKDFAFSWAAAQLIPG